MKELEILMIDHGNTSWINPEIEEICSFTEDTINQGLWDNDVHRIWLETKSGKICHFVVKSSLLDEYWDIMIGSDFENPPELKLSQKIHLEDLEIRFRTLLEVMIFEDVWSPVETNSILLNSEKN